MDAMEFSSINPEHLLFDAARKGDVALIKELLAEGVNVDVRDGRGFTPMILASY
ncbi:ankyrin repeat domain-containing protein [Rufibacter sp. DG15C]|uniref:ankyrin repeat domain-containing protein n=1 Tax=Rufibacter sp. DG15C TaxID=1379909 RepID=UPI000AC79B41